MVSVNIFYVLKKLIDFNKSIRAINVSYLPNIHHTIYPIQFKYDLHNILLIARDCMDGKMKTFKIEMDMSINYYQNFAYIYANIEASANYSNNVDIQYILTEMGLFDNKLYNFIMLLFVSGIIVQIMKFFDIEFVFYISYLLWFIAIGIFVIVLPRGQSSVI